MEKIKIAAVSYLNTKPFLFGIQHSDLMNEIELIIDHPSVIAEELKNGRADIGLLPVTIISEIPGAQIISDYCIGSEGRVASVCIYSDVPLEEVKEIFLDYQSRTSVALTKVLLRDYWKIRPKQIPSYPGYEEFISGSRAGLIIGDRALQAKNKFRYSYDLGEAWKQYTGMPFVFACWVANKTIEDSFLHRFNEALKSGVNHINEVAKQNAADFPGIDVHDYLIHKVQFQLTEEKQKALEHFLFLMKEQMIIAAE